MPVKSAKQFRFMEAAAHGGISGMASPSPEVAKEFLNKTPEGTKSRFAKSKTDKFTSAMRKKKSAY